MKAECVNKFVLYDKAECYVFKFISSNVQDLFFLLFGTTNSFKECTRRFRSSSELRILDRSGIFLKNILKIFRKLWISRLSYLKISLKFYVRKKNLWSQQQGLALKMKMLFKRWNDPAHRWMKMTPKMSTLRRLLINLRFILLHHKSLPAHIFLSFTSFHLCERQGNTSLPLLR